MKFIYLYLPIYYYLICFTYLIRQAASHARFLKLKKKYNIHWQRDWRLSASWGSTTQYDSAVMFRGVSGKSPQLGGSSWCRETPISRTAVRLITVVFFPFWTILILICLSKWSCTILRMNIMYRILCTILCTISRFNNHFRTPRELLLLYNLIHKFI